MFLRFTIGERDPRSHSEKGLFTVAYELQDCGTLSSEVQDIIDWYEEHLPIPPHSLWRRHPRAICWFTACAGDRLTKI
jgi:hypothetical protein